MSKWNDRLAWWLAKKAFDVFASEEYYRQVRANSALGLIKASELEEERDDGSNAS